MKKLIGLATLLCVALFALTLGGEEESDKNNFTITGDFSNTIATDFTGATIVVNATGLSDEGESTQIELASTEIVDGKFLLEGVVDEAILADISLTIPKSEASSLGQVILEPGGELTLEYIGPRHDLIATGEGLHAELISSWELDPEYLDASIALSFYMERIYADLDKQRAAAEAEAEAAESDETATDSDEVADEVSDEDTQSAEVAKEREPSEHAEVLDWKSMECADYAVENYVNYIHGVSDTSEYPLLIQATTRMNAIMDKKRNAVLDKIAIESNDPKKRFFAMELGALVGLDKQKEALSVWEQLVDSLDESTVVARVQPIIDRLERSISTLENEEYLIPGVFAPNFTLPNFEGEDVSLESVLGEHEVVMIDFWASWCGPCIAQFPHLKELYAEYAEKGFEIVGISLDDSQEDWTGAVEEHQPPWINLLEIKNEHGWGLLSQEYGVSYIPLTFVLDDESCIMKKDLRPDELEDFLKARLDS